MAVTQTTTTAPVPLATSLRLAFCQTRACLVALSEARKRVNDLRDAHPKLDDVYTSLLAGEDVVGDAARGLDDVISRLFPEEVP